MEARQPPLALKPVVKGKTQLTSHELLEFLADKKIKLGCGHYFQLHPFSNTMVITAYGQTLCHNCYD
jgi:hypothetical protein